MPRTTKPSAWDLSPTMKRLPAATQFRAGWALSLWGFGSPHCRPKCKLEVSSCPAKGKRHLRADLAQQSAEVLGTWSVWEQPLISVRFLEEKLQLPCFWKGYPWLLFINFNVPMKHLGIFIKFRFWVRRFGLGKRLCIFNKLWGNANAASLGTPLSDPTENSWSSPSE